MTDPTFFLEQNLSTILHDLDNFQVPKEMQFCEELGILAISPPREKCTDSTKWIMGCLRRPETKAYVRPSVYLWVGFYGWKFRVICFRLHWSEHNVVIRSLYKSKDCKRSALPGKQGFELLVVFLHRTSRTHLEASGASKLPDTSDSPAVRNLILKHLNKTMSSTSSTDTLPHASLVYSAPKLPSGQEGSAFLVVIVEKYFFFHSFS